MKKFWKRNKVVLREQRREGDYRYLGAEIKENGDLYMEGQDLGSGVEEAFGCREYEWCWTVKAQDIEKLKIAIGSEGEILDLLKKHFSNEKAAGLYKFMRDHDIPFESWSRIGD